MDAVPPPRGCCSAPPMPPHPPPSTSVTSWGLGGLWGVNLRRTRPRPCQEGGEGHTGTSTPRRGRRNPEGTKPTPMETGHDPT